MAPHAPRAQSEAEHFDRLADATGEIWWGSATTAGRARLKRRAQLLMQALGEYEDPLVVELGCGTGAFSEPVLEQFPSLRLRGIDVSAKSVAVAAERLGHYSNAAFHVGDALNLDQTDASVDAVVGNSVLHHLPLGPCLAEIRRVLKPNGLLWFSEPNMMNPEVALEKNVRVIGRLTQTTPDETAFFRWSLVRRLRAAGFRGVQVRPYDFLHPLVPSPLVGFASRVGRCFERVPLFKEMAGSLLISAKK